MTDRTPIDFGALAAALLDRAYTLVPQWLPHGIERAGRWYIGDFDGSPGESANVNLATGQWYDNAGGEEDKGGDLIGLYARIRGLSNGPAARELMRDLGWDRSQASASARGGKQSAADRDERPEPPPPEGAITSQRKRTASKWQAITPVPPHAPMPDFVFGYRDRTRGDMWVELDAARTWRYEFEGALYGYVARFERVSSDGELVKDTVPRTWCQDTSDPRGLQRWHWKAWDSPRPLYVPRGHLRDPSVPVVVVEGEKCAEALHELLGDQFDVVSWPGGCKTWALASWGWLMGRVVYLWPDCDAKREPLSKADRDKDPPPLKAILPEVKQPGMKAMTGIGSVLLADQACTVFLCPIPAPGQVADGWDVADAIAEGWDAVRTAEFIRGSRVFVAPDDAARAKAAKAGAPPTSAGAGRGGFGGDGAGDVDEDDEPDRRWRAKLQKTAQGATRPVRENIVLALDGLPSDGIPGVPEAAGLIAFNEFTNNVEKRRDTPWGTKAGPWDEADELLMGEWLVHEYWLPSVARSTLEEAVLIVAHRHRFHPERERIGACRGKWDGTRRLDTWLRRCCLEDDEFDDESDLMRYLAMAGRWFIMGLCCRVLEQEKQGTKLVRGPGTKFDYMLIFEGVQGLGKSSLAAVLGGEHFADTGLIIGEKDSYQNIQGVLVYEWGELDSLSRSDIRKVKQFVSSSKDRFRASFDRRPRDYPRQVVFVGTTNERNYLTDPTGNRRFWPVACTRAVDNEWVRQNLEQLFAEALHYLDAGEKFWPSPAEQRQYFDPQQQERKVESSLESSLRTFLYDEDQHVAMGQTNGAYVNEIGMNELLDRVGYSRDKQTDAVVKNTGALMHAFGWTIKRSTKPGRPRHYVRPKDDPLGRAAIEAGAANVHGTSSRTPDDIPF